MEYNPTKLLSYEEGMKEYTVRTAGNVVSINQFEKNHCSLFLVVCGICQFLNFLFYIF